MLDDIKDITDDNFFFWEDSKQVYYIVCLTQSNWVKNVIFMFPHFDR